VTTNQALYQRSGAAPPTATMPSGIAITGDHDDVASGIPNAKAKPKEAKTRASTWAASTSARSPFVLRMNRPVSLRAPASSVVASPPGARRDPPSASLRRLVLHGHEVVERARRQQLQQGGLLLLKHPE
jgi:hypothetical protein